MKFLYKNGKLWNRNTSYYSMENVDIKWLYMPSINFDSNNINNKIKNPMLHKITLCYFHQINVEMGGKINQPRISLIIT